MIIRQGFQKKMYHIWYKGVKIDGYLYFLFPFLIEILLNLKYYEYIADKKTSRVMFVHNFFKLILRKESKRI